jgi:hypothetical protein
VGIALYYYDNNKVKLLRFILIYDFFFMLQIKPQENTDIMKDFDEPGHLAPTGLHLAGVKYMVIQGESGAVIRGKKVIY